MPIRSSSGSRPSDPAELSTSISLNSSRNFASSAGPCVFASMYLCTHKKGKSTEERDAERQKHRQRQRQRDKGGRGRGRRREGEREEDKGWGLREYLHWGNTDSLHEEWTQLTPFNECSFFITAFGKKSCGLHLNSNKQTLVRHSLNGYVRNVGWFYWRSLPWIWDSRRSCTLQYLRPSRGWQQVFKNSQMWTLSTIYCCKSKHRGLLRTLKEASCGHLHSWSQDSPNHDWSSTSYRAHENSRCPSTFQPCSSTQEASETLLLANPLHSHYLCRSLAQPKLSTRF